ncbi:hypothetical protein GCM10011534_32210 [Pseudooceanicola nanhaiensis]|uniref:Uncharacterized protein n=1 Tax=Pseudooceanicola nanhaiensis TaxID=375761 RepID=A0A917T277_9RHOB|nr:hypothetical protein GCM10011534_32210 [Pseudooceanicola nanhaiensis]
MCKGILVPASRSAPAPAGGPGRGPLDTIGSGLNRAGRRQKACHMARVTLTLALAAPLTE